MADNSSIQFDEPLESVDTLFPKAWTLDVLRGAREHCMGRSFATEYQQIPFDEESARQRDSDEEHHADYRAWLRSRVARTTGRSLAVEGME